VKTYPRTELSRRTKPSTTVSQGGYYAGMKFAQQF
jgi:hypothetical protein